MATITYEAATRQYAGTDRPAVDGLELDIADGEFLVLVGPSGCGKSTSLRMLAGLEEIDSGSVHIGTRDVTELPPKQRDIAMVFQSYALYPHMTVAENMGFALRVAKVPKSEIRSRVSEAARLLDLTEYLDRKPKALSGGQRQRVAMGRAIVREPQAFLMDEPLSNLDAKLRSATRAQIASLQRRLGVTTVYVTHDQVEAMTMGDRVAVLDDGALQQCDTPRVLYDKPCNAFVAGFIGSPPMNLCRVTPTASGLMLGTNEIPLPGDVLAELTANGTGRGEVLLGVRPEALETTTDGVPMTVDLVEELGAEALCHGRLAAAEGEEEITLVVRVDARVPPAIGSQVRLRIRPGEHHFFAPDTGHRITT